MLLEIHENAGFRSKKQTANEYASSCPTCGGRDRFVIFLSEDRFWCRGCGAHGDALQYLRDFQKLSYQESAAIVGKDISALTKHTSSPAPRPTEPAKKQPPLWRQRAAAGIQRAHAALLKNPEALNWLRQERGITAETAERFRLGWLAQDLFFKKEEFGLPADGKVLVVPAGLVIPWQDKRIRIRRNHDEDAQKYGRYHVVTGSDTEPMTIGSPYETTAIVVESELDAILLFQEVKRPLFIVAMGSAAIKPGPELFKQLSFCPVVLVCLDSDKAGGKAAMWWLENVPQAHHAPIPSQHGKDITEAFLQGYDLNIWLSAALLDYAETVNGEPDAALYMGLWENAPCQ